MAGDPPSPLPANSASRPAEGRISAGATGPPWGVFGSDPSRYGYLNGRSKSGFYRDKDEREGRGTAQSRTASFLPGQGGDWLYGFWWLVPDVFPNKTPSAFFRTLSRGSQGFCKKKGPEELENSPGPYRIDVSDELPAL